MLSAQRLEKTIKIGAKVMRVVETSGRDSSVN
jgi:hypothetical protein